MEEERGVLLHGAANTVLRGGGACLVRLLGEQEEEQRLLGPSAPPWNDFNTTNTTV